MSEEDSQIHDEQPEIEPSALESEPMISEPIEAEIEAPPVEPEFPEEEPPELLPEVEPPPPSKVRLFLNRALRWITGIMLVFVLGVVAMWAIRVRPVQSELQSLQTDLEAMQEQVTTLEMAQSIATFLRHAGYNGTTPEEVSPPKALEA